MSDTFDHVGDAYHEAFEDSFHNGLFGLEEPFDSGEILKVNRFSDDKHFTNPDQTSFFNKLKPKTEEEKEIEKLEAQHDKEIKAHKKEFMRKLKKREENFNPDQTELDL